MVRRALVAEVWEQRLDDEEDRGEAVTYVDFVGNEVTEYMQPIPPRNRDRSECGHNTRRLDSYMGMEVRATRTRGDGPAPPDADDGSRAAEAATFARRQVYTRAEALVSRNGHDSQPVPAMSERGTADMYDGYNLRPSFRPEPYAPPTNRGDGVAGVAGAERLPVQQLQLNRGEVDHQQKYGDYENSQVGHRKSAFDVGTRRELVALSKWDQVPTLTNTRASVPATSARRSIGRTTRDGRSEVPSSEAVRGVTHMWTASAPAQSLVQRAWRDSSAPVLSPRRIDLPRALPVHGTKLVRVRVSGVYEPWRHTTRKVSSVSSRA